MHDNNQSPLEGDVIPPEASIPIEDRYPVMRLVSAKDSALAEKARQAKTEQDQDAVVRAFLTQYWGQEESIEITDDMLDSMRQAQIPPALRNSPPDIISTQFLVDVALVTCAYPASWKCTDLLEKALGGLLLSILSHKEYPEGLYTTFSFDPFKISTQLTVDTRYMIQNYPERQSIRPYLTWLVQINHYLKIKWRDMQTCPPSVLVHAALQWPTAISRATAALGPDNPQELQVDWANLFETTEPLYCAGFILEPCKGREDLPDQFDRQQTQYYCRMASTGLHVCLVVKDIGNINVALITIELNHINGGWQVTGDAFEPGIDVDFICREVLAILDREDQQGRLSRDVKFDLQWPNAEWLGEFARLPTLLSILDGKAKKRVFAIAKACLPGGTLVCD